MIHLMALATGGWLLLNPPLKTDQNGFAEVDETRPYSEWHQRSAHDTAKECEVKREDLFWKTMLQFEQRNKQRAKKRDEQPTEDRDQITEKILEKPSKTLSRFKSEFDASLRSVQACGQAPVTDVDPPDSRECAAKRKDLSVKFGRYMNQLEKERQQRETPVETEKRHQKFDKALADYRRLLYELAQDRAGMRARCIPFDMLFSQPKNR